MRNSSSAAAAAVTGLAVAAGAATTVVAAGSRPSPRQLSDRGWTCFLPPAPGEVVPTPSMPHRAIALTTMPKETLLRAGTSKTGATGLEPATSGVTVPRRDLPRVLAGLR